MSLFWLIKFNLRLALRTLMVVWTVEACRGHVTRRGRDSALADITAAFTWMKLNK